MEPNSPTPPPGSPERPPGQPPLATPVSAQPARPPAKKPARNAAKFVLLLLVLGLLGSIVLNFLLCGLVGLTGLASLDKDRKVREKFYSHQKDGRHKVAVLSIEGTIISGEGFAKDQIDQAMKDKNLKALVLRVNSPGGTITGSDYIYHHLRKLAEKRKIPIVVSMGGLAASGGYYISMAVGDTPDSIYAEPTTWTGSIGVIIPHYDLSKMLDHWGVEEDSITSDPLKRMGSFARPMTEKERRIFQALVDDGFTTFKDAVKKGRPKFREDSEALDVLATGQIFTARQAVENGLVDKIGFLDDAIEGAIKLAKLDPAKVKVVRYRREPTLADVLMGAEARAEPFDLAAMLEMTAPRAYYLCTWLPPLAGTAKQ